MNIANMANVCDIRVCTNVLSRVYQMFARLDQTSGFLIRVWSAGRPLISTGNQIKGERNAEKCDGRDRTFR